MIIKLKKVFEKIKEVGLIKFFIGLIKACYYLILFKKYDFEKWHISPKEFRPYAVDIINYINNKNEQHDFIVEIGCGLGEIIRNIKIENKIGMDINNKVIEAAKYLGKRDKTQYVVGSFNDLKISKTIDCLITVNFIHTINELSLKKLYNNITKQNNIELIIVDTVLSPNYKNNHNFDKVIPKEYILKEKMGPYLSDRYILIFKKIKN